jgi:aldehyde dehydrogenase
MLYAAPGSDDAIFSFKDRYENFIGGEWVPPVDGEYFDNISPVNGAAFCEIPRSGAGDLHKALDAAHGAADAWGKTAVAERSNTLLKIADRIEQNLETLAYV